ncbi:hypothetical protein SDC9_181611 [bioreactor metagenome]|uniref:Uncharacterized protein n=1 Tax=bioreactor metagenome TaxID=1076179 RepID=A0A645H547_9ZZZZ
MIPEGSHGIFKHGKYKPIHVFNYAVKGKVIVVQKALKYQFVPGLFHQFKPY